MAGRFPAGVLVLPLSVASSCDVRSSVVCPSITRPVVEDARVLIVGYDQLLVGDGLPAASGTPDIRVEDGIAISSSVGFDDEIVTGVVVIFDRGPPTVPSSSTHHTGGHSPTSRLATRPPVRSSSQAARSHRHRYRIRRPSRPPPRAPRSPEPFHSVVRTTLTERCIPAYARVEDDAALRGGLRTPCGVPG